MFAAKWPCWYLNLKGRAIIRNGGEVIYDGPADDMPPEIKEFSLTFDVPFETAAPILFGEQQEKQDGE